MAAREREREEREKNKKVWILMRVRRRFGKVSPATSRIEKYVI